MGNLPGRIGILTGGGDCLGLNVVISGDGTLACTRVFFERGLNCIGVPKTIDIAEPAGRQRTVPPDHPLIAAARSARWPKGRQRRISSRPRPQVETW
jgi:hypothetical protein